MSALKALSLTSSGRLLFSCRLTGSTGTSGLTAAGLGSDKSDKSATEHGKPAPTPQRSPKFKPALSRGLAKLSSSLLLASQSAAVVRGTTPKGQPLPLVYHTKNVDYAPVTLAASLDGKLNAALSGNGNGNGGPNNAQKASVKTARVASKPQPRPAAGEVKGQRWSEDSQSTHVNHCSKDGDSHKISLSLDFELGPLQDSIPDNVTPSIITVERAAAAKIYLETYFNELLAGNPTPRTIRKRLLEADLYRQVGWGRVTPIEQDMIWRHFYQRETEYLRELRVMKTHTIRTLSAERGSPLACLIDDFELVKVIGKGSFGVVGLVRDRVPNDRRDQMPASIGGSDGEYGHEARQVYAMKVIRKSKMLRANQEGHLRAERDFLVASEGSEW